MAFSFTAAFNLTGPVNLAQVRRNIQTGLAGVSVPINVTTAGGRQLDALNTSLAAANTRMMQATKTSDNFSKSLYKQGEALGSAGRRYATFITGAAAFFALFKQLGKAQDEFLKFQNGLVRLAQITGNSVENVKGIGDEVDKLATKYGIAASKLIGVADTLAQAGYSAKDTKVALDALAQSDIAPTFGNIENTIQGAIAVMAQFNYETKDLYGVLGKMNKVAASFAVESSDIVTAIRISGGSFKAAGGDLEQLMALFTSVRATTRESAETIATGFRTIFTRLQRKDTLIFLENLGIQLKDMEGQFVGPYEAINRLSQALSQVKQSDPRFSQVIEELGGYRQISKVIPLITKFGSTAKSALQVAKDGGNSLEESTAKSSQSVSRQLAKLGEQFNKLYRDVANSEGIKRFAGFLLTVASAAVKLADSLSEAIGMFVALQGLASLGALTPIARGFVSGFANPKGMLRGRANGGRVDKFASGGDKKAGIPNSMVMPGEIVISKEMAEKIGYANLDKINKGMAVVPGTGNTDSVMADLSPGDFVLRKAVSQKLLGKGFARGGLKGYMSGTPATGAASGGQASNFQASVLKAMDRRESRRKFTIDVKGMDMDELSKTMKQLTAKINNLRSNAKSGLKIDLGDLEDARMKKAMARTEKIRKMDSFQKEGEKLLSNEQAAKAKESVAFGKLKGKDARAQFKDSLPGMDSAKLQGLAAGMTKLKEEILKARASGKKEVVNSKGVKVADADAKTLAAVMEQEKALKLEQMKRSKTGNKQLNDAEEAMKKSIIEFTRSMDGADFTELTQRKAALEQELTSAKQAVAAGTANDEQKMMASTGDSKLRAITSARYSAAGLQGGVMQSKAVSERQSAQEMANRRLELAQTKFGKNMGSRKEIEDAQKLAEDATKKLAEAIKAEYEMRKKALMDAESDQSITPEERRSLKQKQEELDLSMAESEANDSKGQFPGFRDALDSAAVNLDKFAIGLPVALIAIEQMTNVLGRMSDTTAVASGEISNQQKVLAEQTAASKAWINSLTVAAGAMFAFQKVLAIQRVSAAVTTVAASLSGLGVAVGLSTAAIAGIMTGGIVALAGGLAYLAVRSQMYAEELGKQIQEARQMNLKETQRQLSDDLEKLSNSVTLTAENISGTAAKFNDVFAQASVGDNSTRMAVQSEETTMYDRVANVFGEWAYFTKKIDDALARRVKDNKGSILNEGNKQSDLLNKMITQLVQSRTGKASPEKLVEEAIKEVGFDTFAEKMAEVRRASGDLTATQKKLIAETVENQLKIAKTSEEFDKLSQASKDAVNNIRRFKTLGYGLDAAILSLGDFEESLGNTGLAFGDSGGGVKASGARGLEALGTNNFQAFDNAADMVASSFGEMGEQLASEAKFSNALTTKLEDILGRVKAETPLMEKEPFSDAVKKGLREMETQYKQRDNKASDVIASKIRSLGDVDVREKGKNLKAFAEELVEGLGESSKILQDLNGKMAEASNKFIGMYAQYNAMVEKKTQNDMAAIDTMAELADMRAKYDPANVNGVTEKVGEAVGGKGLNEFYQKIRMLTGGATGAAGIGNKFAANQKRIDEIAGMSPEKITGAIGKEFQDLTQTNKNLFKALDEISKVNSRLTKATERLAQIEAEKTNRGGINAEIATGGMKVVREMAMDDLALRKALVRGKLREDIQNPDALRENERALRAADRMQGIEANGAVPAKFRGQLGFRADDRVTFGQMGDALKKQFRAILPGQGNRANLINGVLQRNGRPGGIRNQQDMDKVEAQLPNIVMGMEKDLKNEQMRRNRQIAGKDKDPNLKVVARLSKEELKAQGKQKQVLGDRERFETDVEKRMRTDIEKLRDLIKGGRINNEAGSGQKNEEKTLQKIIEEQIAASAEAIQTMSKLQGEAITSFPQKLLEAQDIFFKRLSDVMTQERKDQIQKEIDKVNTGIQDIDNRKARTQIERKSIQDIGSFTEDEAKYLESDIGFNKLKQLKDAESTRKSNEGFLSGMPTGIKFTESVGMWGNEDQQKRTENTKNYRETFQKLEEEFKRNYGEEQATQYFEEAKKNLGYDEGKINGSRRVTQEDATRINEGLAFLEQNMKENINNGNSKINSLRVEIDKNMDVSKLNGLDSRDVSNIGVARGVIKNAGYDPIKDEANRSAMESQRKQLEAQKAEVDRKVRESVDAARQRVEVTTGQPAAAVAVPNGRDQAVKNSVKETQNMMGGIMSTFTGFFSNFDSSIATLTKSLDMLQGAKIEIAGNTNVNVNLTGTEALLKIGEGIKAEVLAAVGDKLKSSFPGNSGQIAANFPSKAGRTGQSGEQA